MNIGERIKVRRELLGISAEKLGELIGKSKSTIHRYEAGDIEKIPTSILIPLANALMTTPSYLMGWTDDYQNEKTKVSEFILKLENKEFEKLKNLLISFFNYKE